MSMGPTTPAWGTASASRSAWISRFSASRSSPQRRSILFNHPIANACIGPPGLLPWLVMKLILAQVHMIWTTTSDDDSFDVVPDRQTQRSTTRLDVSPLSQTVRQMGKMRYTRTTLL